MGNRGSSAFMGADEYAKTNIYMSKVLHHGAVTSYESSYVQRYTQTMNRKINAALRKGTTHTQETEAVRELDKCVIGLNHSDIYGVFQQLWSIHNLHVDLPATTSLPNPKDFIIVFRGTGVRRSDIQFLKACHKKDKCVRNKCFLSCSMQHEIAMSFQNIYAHIGEKVLFVIYLHKEDRRSYAYVKSLSHCPSEEEVLVRPCRRFRIGGIEYNDDLLRTTTISLISTPS